MEFYAGFLNKIRRFLYYDDKDLIYQFWAIIESVIDSGGHQFPVQALSQPLLALDKTYFTY